MVARAVAKRDRLLEGEDPESLRPQDTRHWISVYREMIAFKEDLLTRVSGDLKHLRAHGLAPTTVEVLAVCARDDVVRRHCA